MPQYLDFITEFGANNYEVIFNGGEVVLSLGQYYNYKNKSPMGIQEAKEFLPPLLENQSRLGFKCALILALGNVVSANHAFDEERCGGDFASYLMKRVNGNDGAAAMTPQEAYLSVIGAIAAAQKAAE